MYKLQFCIVIKLMMSLNAYYDMLLFAAMIFESCGVDARSGNILASPELTLLSDQKLTFTMAPVSSEYHITVNVYQTSMFGRIGALLGSFAAITSGRNIFDDKTYSMCLPAGTYRLAFIASEATDATESTAAVTKVLFTNSSCTYTSLAGNL